MKIEPVIQEEATGCGIACVAMLTQKTYKEIKEIANTNGIFAEDEKLWSETNYVRILLHKLNIKTESNEIKFSSWDELPGLALLSIKYRIENDRPLWHWVVFKRDNGQDMVLDPAAYLEENKRTDFEMMNPEWFIKIEETEPR